MERERHRHGAHFRESIVIRVTPAAAFAYLGDPATATIIDPAVASYETSTLPMRVGTVNTVKVRMFGLRLTMVTQVLTWDEGHRMVIESVRPARPVKASATHLFEPHADGTLYTWAMEFVPTGLGGGLAAWFFRRFMQRNARRQQTLLKRALEDGR
jgi:hypothetical protein